MSGSANIQQSKNARYYIIVAICVIIMFIGKYIPPFAPEITPVGMGVLGVFVGVVVLWSTVGGAIWPSILAIIALAFTGYTDVNGSISSSMGSFMVFNMICISAMTSALSATGADVKIAKWLITRKAWQGKPILFTFAFLFAFYVVSALTFAFAMIFICWTILRKMAEEMGVSMTHPYFVTMSIYSVIATSMGEFVIPMKGWQYALCNIFMMNAGGQPVNFGLFIVSTFIIGVVIIFILVALMKPLFKVDFSPVANHRPDSATVGDTRLTKNQVAIVVVLVVSMICSIFVNYIQGDGWFVQIVKTLSLPGIFGLAVVILCAIKDKTGKPILEFTKVMNGVVWAPILLVGIAVALASALTSGDCGFMAFFGRTLSPIVEGKSVAVVYIFIIVIVCVLTNIASNMGIGLMIIPVAVPICLAAGCNMNVAAIVCIYSACFGFILPGSAAVSPLMYSNETLKKGDILKTTSIGVLIYMIIGCIVFPLMDAMF